MSTAPLSNNPQWAWTPFAPGPNDPWDQAKVAHLHRRAGFAPPWSVIERDRNDGPDASIARLLNGEALNPRGLTASEFEAQAEEIDRLGASGTLVQLQAAWLSRMILTPHTLRERMTLFWHDHFATSNAKVKNVALMARQNALLRCHALGDFKAMLTALSHDPALLIWLDATSNHKAHPNENYAREVMELFTLGRGRYTEPDVQEAARALTGGFVREGRFVEVAAQHDDDPKTILGQTGRFGGDDLTRILLEQPACAEFLSGKLFAHLVSDVDAPTPELLAPLAIAFRESGYDVRVPLEMILRSNLFFSPAARRRKIKGPVEFAVGTVRALEVMRPTVSAEALAESCRRMGQSLYAPPSVAGWDDGPAWINTATSLARTNVILGLTADSKRFDAKALAGRFPEVNVSEFYVELLVQDAFEDSVRRKVAGSAREVATLVLTSPEYQLA
ncbi:MAG: DUF1800 domain-containing protein [Isosphaeraceae bacterium]